MKWSTTMAWMSIMGMYEYNPDMFDHFNVPQGMDKETCVNNILLQCAELEVLYPTPSVMKLAIKTWSDSCQYTWDKLYQTTVVEYNPIWNVDADIEEIGTGNRGIDRNRSGSGSDNRIVNLQDNETVDLTDIKSVQGFNSASWAEAEKNTKTGTDNVAHTGTDNIARTDTESENISETSGDTRRTGNIGVTTTQQMLEQERVIAELNMVEYITNSFKKRFCIMIY